MTALVSFVATGVAIACLVDLTRLSIYAKTIVAPEIAQNGILLLCAIGAAFLGAWIRSRMLRKVTIRTIQIVIAYLLVVFATGLGLGLI